LQIVGVICPALLLGDDVIQFEVASFKVAIASSAVALL